jgi:hypothetical protein
LLITTLAALCVAILPSLSAASSRDVMLEDLRTTEVQDDLYHRGERPGKVVRVVPWIDEDGDYSVLAITEVGWVYQAAGDPSEWVLIGRIFDVGCARSASPLMH